MEYIFDDPDFIIHKGILLKYAGDVDVVDIPYGVTKIGKQAFYYCDVQEVNIPETVTVIDEGAFSNCEGLEEISLPNYLLSIGREAFASCKSLETIALPESLEEIGSGAFENCWSLAEIKLPEGLKRIGTSAFAATGIREICIPNGISSIESRTFESCFKLKRVVLPNQLKSIGGWAFKGCHELADITFPETLSDLGSEPFSGCEGISDDNGFIVINNDLSYYNGNDRVIRIPDGVKRINSNVFSKKNRIVKVVLPNSLKSIGTYAFGGCQNLREINITFQTTDIDRAAFSDCKRLADENSFIIFNKVLFEYFGNESKIEVPNGVEIIGAHAFLSAARNQIEEMIIPETVHTIEEGAFSCCHNLKRVEMPKALNYLGEEAFEYCDSLTSITVPEGIETLNFKTFSNCDKLKEIILPNSLKKMEYMAICECASLEDIDIPVGVEEIGGNQFSNCDNLKIINIPDTVTQFEDSKLKDVRLNISKLGKSFKATLKHQWGGTDERALWKMVNEPSIDLFNSIKTAVYKIALAERLYPDYQEYGPYLKKNIYKAVRDAALLDDDELLDSLKATGFAEESKLEECILQVQNEKTLKAEGIYNKAKCDLANAERTSVFGLLQTVRDLENIRDYYDTEELIHAYEKAIANKENAQKEVKYKEAVKSMNENGGMTPLYLDSSIKLFFEVRDYKDSDELMKECERRLGSVRDKNRETTYQTALEQLNKFDGSNREVLEEAIDLFEWISGYKDSEKILRDYYKQYWDMDI